jgi:hypothetical protein
MSTKFVSKNSNYMVVLKPGKEGNRATGTQAVSGLYVKFDSGVVDIKDEAITEMMREHPDCGTAFVEVKENEIDPYAELREEAEPKHVTSEIKYGHIVGREGTPIKTNISPKVKELIKAEAIKMIPGILKQDPELIKGILREMAAEAVAKDKKALETAPEVVVDVVNDTTVTVDPITEDITTEPTITQDALKTASKKEKKK